MSLGYDTQTKIDNAVCKNQKHITVTFNALVSAKPCSVIEALLKTFSREFEKVHEKDKQVRALNCNILVKGFDTEIDMGGKTSEKMRLIREDFEKKTGLIISGYSYTYEKVNPQTNELPNWTFHFSFYDAEPEDPFTGGKAWNLYRR